MEDNLPVNVREYQELAKKALPKMHYDYINGGAEDEYTLRENIAAYGRILLRPRVLIDVSKIDMSTTLLGYNMPSPIIVAPTGAHKLANPEGEVATARAAAACNTIMVLSFGSSCKIEEVASSCDAIRFYQLYVYRRRDVSATLVRRAESLGFKAIVLTVDTPVLGRREADIRNKMVAPRMANLEGLMSFDDDIDSKGGSKLERFAHETLDPSLSWKDVEWLKSITSLPILLKGIVTAEDARKAVEVGAAGVIVSNHGARQLDYAPPTISALEEVTPPAGRIHLPSPDSGHAAHMQMRGMHVQPAASVMRARRRAVTATYGGGRLRGAAGTDSGPGCRCRWLRRWRGPCRCWWTAGSGGAPTCSRRWRWAPRQSWWGGRCSTGWRRAGRPGRGTSSRC
ncbi:peroxisomal (S)-2-hydroxy-acid oxidase GLO4 isoform X1 [Panicum virgatum]|uniref:(S)-2-hydroxy-acid oxidase n=1 Tax=Panicum virgatum TaxID=38727 RepID=A0A8T0VQ94_PANVG|nr:peroxisomal (S)-2-hydroxy-acid oxidase GLO4 isoform X1 [Panicum virgatum]KAG2638352.1 hypothetical protein PVAP13_2NG587500 [Panicum virgatum]